MMVGAMIFISYSMLFFFIPYSRSIFILVLVLSIPIFIQGAYIPIEFTLVDDLANYVEGITDAGIIFFAYFTPLKVEFTRQTIT